MVQSNKIDYISYLMYLNGNSLLKEKAIQLVKGDISLAEVKKSPTIKKFIQDCEKDKPEIDHEQFCAFLSDILFE